MSSSEDQECHGHYYCDKTIHKYKSRYRDLCRDYDQVCDQLDESRLELSSANSQISSLKALLLLVLHLNVVHSHVTNQASST